ncbi:MAG: FHA domain-containing protein [Proteobacteria bacterium]|nr:FHA domain-containing protein [Pseudomonadota bacterium]
MSVVSALGFAVVGALAMGAGLAALRWYRERGRAGRIVFLNGPRRGDQIRLHHGRIRIGALTDNDIVIPTKEVSRYHAELRVREDRIQIWDLQSRNETFVNGASVKTSELEPGDIVSIAGVEMRYER